MIVYTASKSKFLDDVLDDQIHEVIHREFQRKLFRRAGDSEVNSWRNSMKEMRQVLNDPDIPGDSLVSIEYNIPLTGKRIDFILTGRNAQLEECAVIIELKQWSDVQATKQDAVVNTWLGKGNINTPHPSYQAWTYAALIEDYSEVVQNEQVRLSACAYLHNLNNAQVINDPFYKAHTDRAPVFISKDARKLSEFLKKHVKYGDQSDLMYRIEHGKIRPSKNLADSLANMLLGNREFLMIDDQKLVYEMALDMAHARDDEKKRVLIVEGGPGTGKSVVAINLLSEFTQRGKVCQYVSKNAAPRAVFEAKLTGTFKKTRIANLFRGSGNYIDAESNFFDVLIVDEGQRLTAKSGLLSNKGENQIKELIHASKLCIFFLDEDQRVTFKDIGSKAEIRKWAKALGTEVIEQELRSQFRCNGSDGYIAWLNHHLHIKSTANLNMDGLDFDFKVFDSPTALHNAIRQKNEVNNKARVVAGYCWDWKSKKTPKAFDIEFPEYGYKAQWNLDDDGSTWIIKPNSVEQVGCIHTCQGLELDYVGVIVGPDFVVRNGEVITDAFKRSNMDQSIKGFKGGLKTNRANNLALADAVIKNTYKTLMTRGMKGCYVYFTDEETRAHFKALLTELNKVEVAPMLNKYEGLDLPIVQAGQEAANSVPIFDLKFAAGQFSEYQEADTFDHVVLPTHLHASEGYFVARVEGDSMNKRIHPGAWCLFHFNPQGTRNGKIVVVQHRRISDPELGGQYTIKRYKSEKHYSEDGVVNSVVVLKPESTNDQHEAIVLSAEDAEEMVVVAEFLTVV
ncbi:AAA family ATPase [Limnobacter sp. 130]|uniref:DNA/RNA helicase domain-containing protein n=1 Tax=Limnobacter sp. 130 TaxID=2653147 RepID=UPI0012F44ACE|nr:DNA/RNA helicase domain-containing protein [Limnobacter sp. 130]VWX37325.1 AAA family ATPase [Limnobacter sp. 130]